MRVQALGNWQARALAFGLGALAVLAMPPLYQIYLLVPAFGGLLWLATGQSSGWRAFAVGWWFGAGYFANGLYWVSFALLIEADKFAWLIPVAVLGFAFGFGLFPAVAAWLVRFIPGGLAPQALGLAGIWTLLEWVRTWFLTGFPWNPIGSVWLLSDVTAQGAAVAGVLGLGFVAVLAAAAPAALAGTGRGGWVVTGFAAALVAALVAGGQHRLSHAGDDVVEGVRLRLVQPNIRQADKWRPEQRTGHMLNQIELSTLPPAPGDAAPTHVIWAETAAPFFLANHDGWLARLGRAAPPGGLLMTGAPRVVGPSPEGGLEVANSLLAIDDAGRVAATYDKFHLVPFGEYMPLPDWLPLRRITQGVGSFQPGPGPQTLDLPGLPPVSPLICYEIIFPGQVTDGTGRAAWLLNLTNDGWYGKTAGPHQHFVSARTRALEQGVAVVRVAGTGISGIIDAYGRVTARLALGEKGFVDGDLPAPARRPTVYALSGDGPVLALAVAALVLALLWSPLAGRARGNRKI